MRAGRVLLGALAVASVVAAGGCVTTTTAPRPLETHAFVDSLPGRTEAASVAPADAPLPTLAKLQGSSAGGAALSSAPVRRITLINADGSDLRDVLTQVADKLGLSVSVDPDVHARITAHLSNITLPDALQKLVTENGYAYTLQGGVIRVTPVRNQTRTFALDYVALSRVGTATTVVERRFGTSGVSPTISTAPGLSTSSAGASSGIPGGDVVSAVQVSDLWREIQVDLDGMLTLAAAGTPGATGAAAQGVAVTNGGVSGGGTGGTGPFSKTYANGSQLIISPMAGLITVTAPPEKIQEIAIFMDAFTSSVLREVEVEAKIVEVQLTNASQFGIDWSIVGQSGSRYGFSLTNNAANVSNGQAAAQPGNLTFSLTGGNAQINAVVTALQSQGNVNVLSNPRVQVLNNQRAIFDATTNEVFFATSVQPVISANGQTTFTTSIQAQQVAIGIVMDVIPQISADNVLTMLIRPVVTSLVGVDSIVAPDGSQVRIPITGQREGDTMLRTRSGETVVLGGLTQTQHTLSRTGIPVLSDLPGIGRLFKHVSDTEQRVELVFFITATVVAGQPAPRR